ncbi:MAG: DNA polymerase III subunit beta [Coriobacteriaceae bacterium]|nr:DNA polymerase III subunit beta [Coriobacteriaceae bacterium]
MGPVATDNALLREATSRLVAEFHPEQVYLFGSRAWGRPTRDSDYDFMVIVAESDETPARRASRAYRVLWGIEASKDVLVKTRAEFEKYVDVRASLEHRIRERGRLLHG